MTISDATSGATIYYTTNGTTPTTSSTEYSGPVTVSSTETLQAIAVASGDGNSAVASAAYTITTSLPAAATPTFLPAAGAYTSAQSVVLSDSTTGATIYYTTNGTTPTTVLDQVHRPDYGEFDGDFAGDRGSHGLCQQRGRISCLHHCSVPSHGADAGFSPAAGTYNSAQSVSISDATPGATIYYTTNGTTPTSSSTAYSGPITVSSTETLQAIAITTGDSAIASAAYTITSPQPDFLLAASSSSLTVSSWRPGGR